MAGADRRVEGVYAAAPDGVDVLVHQYLSEAYGLADVREFFDVGEATADGLRLSAKDTRILSSHVAAYEFDHDPDFIVMCRDILAFAAGRAVDLFERG